ncbi:hypothetical protein PIB30_006420 [Stylosanthes scabra]|uniref:Uncharacterized protein n=1 Tax=Stylosanthes scabra TaxID=79078 RepID=A0ABU6T686_9FABA|nr:hypothetical protein [Stylosanthes scabra]
MQPPSHLHTRLSLSHLTPSPQTLTAHPQQPATPTLDETLGRRHRRGRTTREAIGVSLHLSQTKTEPPPGRGRKTYGAIPAVHTVASKCHLRRPAIGALAAVAAVLCRLQPPPVLLLNPIVETVGVFYKPRASHMLQQHIDEVRSLKDTLAERDARVGEHLWRMAEMQRQMATFYNPLRPGSSATTGGSGSSTAPPLPPRPPPQHPDHEDDDDDDYEDA